MESHHGKMTGDYDDMIGNDHGAWHGDMMGDYRVI